MALHEAMRKLLQKHAEGMDEMHLTRITAGNGFSTGFTLQSCTNLALGDWKNVTSPAPQIVGDQWQVILSYSTETGSVLYRLSK